MRVDERIPLMAPGYRGLLILDIYIMTIISLHDPDLGHYFRSAVVSFFLSFNKKNHKNK